MRGRVATVWFALRDLRSARVRYLLFTGLVALMGALVLILTGLGLGLSSASVSGVERIPADAWLYQKDVRTFLARSTVTAEQVEAAAGVEGVASAEPMGAFTVSVRRAAGAQPDDVALFGAEPGSTIPPESVDLSVPGAAWLDESLRDSGISVGDTLTVEPSRQQISVAGFVDAGTYSHLPVVYVPLALWQQVKYSTPDGSAPAPASAAGLASAAVLTLDEGVDAAAISDAVAAAVPGTEVVGDQQAVAATPGYKEETGTVNLMVFFLYVIAILVIGTFFWIATVQRTHEVAVLRAIGASRGRIAREHASEVSVVSAVGLVLAAAGSLALATLLPKGVPFALGASTVAATTLVLFVMALGSGLVSLRRLVRVDPMLALGRNL